MGAQLRVFRRRIKSVGATKKITKAMELIASSRIVKAQQRVDAALPYTTELLRALSAAAAHTRGQHRLVRVRREHLASGNDGDLWHLVVRFLRCWPALRPPSRMLSA